MAYPPAIALVELDADWITQDGRDTTLSGHTVFDAAEAYVRRPLRGIRLKRETYASIRVEGGNSVDILNSSLPAGVTKSFTSNFILQSVQDSRQEKFQPISTFGGPYGFFYGEQPRMKAFRAVLLNTADFQWELEWWENYDKFLRGTRLVDRGLQAYLNVDDVVVVGYIVAAATDSDASRPYMANLSFTMWVTDVIPLITPGQKMIDARHWENTGALSLEFGQIDGVETEDSSATAEVRALNIESVALTDGTGFLSGIRNAISEVQDFVDKVGNAIDNALDWLYGRNMVIPAGFAGSELAAGKPIFASGSGFEGLSGTNLGGVLDGSSLNISLPAATTGPGPAQPASHFYDNIDEYPARAADASLNDAQVQNILAAHQNAQDEDLAFYTSLAEETFSSFGINITSQEGQYQSDLVRAAGRASFAALSYGAMTTGAGQAAASLTVIGGTT